MIRRLMTLAMVPVLVAGAGCSNAIDEPSDDSESSSAPRPGADKEDSTTRDTSIEGAIEFGANVDGEYRDEYVGYKFELSGPATVTARVTSADADPAVWLYGPRDSDGDWGYDIESNRDIDYDNDNAEISDAELDEPGTYLVVTGTEDWGESRGSFEMTVECSGAGCDGSADPDEPGAGGSVCGEDAEDGDFVATDDRSVDAMAFGDGYAFAAIDEWKGTISDDDDEVKICAYPVEEDAEFGYDESCFLPEQVETDYGSVENADAMAYESGRLYVAVRDVLSVYDVDDVDAPKQLGSHRIEETFGVVAGGMEVRDGIAYLAGDARILDVSDPSAIESLHDFDHGTVEELTVADGTLYTLTEDRLRSFDVADPSTPRELDTFEPQSDTVQFRDLAVDGGHAYAVSDADSARDDRSGLWVLDVGTPDDLELVHRSEGSPREAFSVAVRDGFAVLGQRVEVEYDDFENRVPVYDVTEPTSPERVETVSPEGIPREMVFHGANVFYRSFSWGTTTTFDDNGIGVVETACNG